MLPYVQEIYLPGSNRDGSSTTVCIIVQGAKLPVCLATAKQPHINLSFCCGKPSTHKETQLGVHRMLVTGCLSRMQVTYKGYKHTEIKAGSICGGH